MNPWYTVENNNKINTSDLGIVPLRTVKVCFSNRNTSLTVHLGCIKAVHSSSLQQFICRLDGHDWLTQLPKVVMGNRNPTHPTEVSLLHLCFRLGWCFHVTIIKRKENKHSNTVHIFRYLRFGCCLCSTIKVIFSHSYIVPQTFSSFCIFSCHPDTFT